MALGRSRGGLTTKVVVCTDRNGLPLGLTLLPGHRHESAVFERVLDMVAVRRATGQTRRRPASLIADTAFDADRIRRWLRQKGIRAVIRPNPSRGRTGRPVTYDAAAYRDRNAIERFIGHVKEHRRIATRYEKLAASYRAMWQIAFIDQYLRHLELQNTA